MTPDVPFCPAPDPNPRAPHFSVPDLACDCHVNVFGPADRYPYQATRSYTPYDAHLEQLFELHSVLGISRAVLVQARARSLPFRLFTDVSSPNVALEGKQGRAA